MPKKGQRRSSTAPRGSRNLKKMERKRRQLIRENRTRRNVALGLITATIFAFATIVYSKHTTLESSDQFKTRLKFYYVVALLAVGSVWSLYDWLRHR